MSFTGTVNRSVKHAAAAHVYNNTFRVREIEYTTTLPDGGTEVVTGFSVSSRVGASQKVAEKYLTEVTLLPPCNAYPHGTILVAGSECECAIGLCACSHQLTLALMCDWACERTSWEEVCSQFAFFEDAGALSQACVWWDSIFFVPYSQLRALIRKEGDQD